MQSQLDADCLRLGKGPTGVILRAGDRLGAIRNRPTITNGMFGVDDPRWRLARPDLAADGPVEVHHLAADLSGDDVAQHAGIVRCEVTPVGLAVVACPALGCANVCNVNLCRGFESERRFRMARPLHDGRDHVIGLRAACNQHVQRRVEHHRVAGVVDTESMLAGRHSKGGWLHSGDSLGDGCRHLVGHHLVPRVVHTECRVGAMMVVRRRDDDLGRVTPLFGKDRSSPRFDLGTVGRENHVQVGADQNHQ